MSGMSVGISQVNFDAQALEDEDEEALEKEDQEREQEIRELLDSELDDGLLDDDNASFSSHDFRSSGYSRDTPFSEDFSEQPPPQSILDHAYGNIRDTIIPSERGAFDRPPLITQRGAQLISGSKHGTDAEGLHEVQYQYDYGPVNFHDHYDDQGYYDYQRALDSPGDREGRNYQGIRESSSNYQVLPGGLNEGLEPYAGYQPHSELAYEAPRVQSHFDSQQFVYHYQHDGFKSNEQSSEFQVYNDRRLTEDEVDGRTQNVHGDNNEGSSDNNHYRLDNPGNYRVQYHGQRETFSHLGERRDLETNRADGGVNEMASAGCEDGGGKTQDMTQLQILYKARGRKLEELSRKLEVQEEEMAKQVRVLNHQNALLRDERDGFSTSLEQSQKVVQECNSEINNLKGQLAASAQQLQAVKSSKDEALSKLHIAETTVDSLNQQVAELSRSESLSRAKEQHENVVNAIKRKHNEENLELKQRLDEAVSTRDWKTEEANRLREELVEKAEMINSLTRSLDSSQKQCQELLQTGTMSEINQLRLALQDSTSARNVLEGECITLKHQLSELQEQVKMYESASRLGVTVGSATLSDTFPHLTVRNLNKENWSTPKSRKLPMEETITDLRKELEQCLVINKTKRAEVGELEKEVSSLKESLRENESKALRMEKIAQEQEERATDLEKKVQYLENEKKDPDKELKKALEEVALARKNLENTTRHLEDTFKEKEELSEACAELKQQMAQMVQEFDEDKRISLEKCREACLQLHEEAKKFLREELNEKHQQFVKGLRDELEEKNEELIRIKECYVQLSEDSRGLREQFNKEKQSLLSERESELVDKLRSSLEKEYTAQLEAAQQEWKADEKKRIEEEILREKEQIVKKMEEEKLQAIEKAVALAVKDSQSDLDKQIAAARKEWLKDHEDELETRLSNAVGEMRRIWNEEQKQTTEEEVEKVREALKKAHHESRHRDINQAVELALSQAHSDWLKNDEEMRQREIDQAVEVAVTNAVAEAKEQWEKEIKAQDNVLQTCITQERLRWKKEEELERSRALEAAVAIAEVKWLKEEQKKITEAVEQALQTSRETWQEEKQRDIAMAVDQARHEWSVLKEEELKRAMETATSKLVEQFEEQKGAPVEKALSQARLQWEQKAAEEKGLEMDSLRREVFKEFQERKEAEVKGAWREEVEEQKQAEINKAIAYLESQYAKGLEEFKRNELRLALEEAKKQWKVEEQSNLEDAVQTRLTSAREEWHKELAQSTQVEVDRALSTAREAWVANYEDELEERVNQLEGSLRERLEAKYAKEKRKLIDDTLKEAQSKFEAEKKKLEEEVRRHKADDSSRDKEKEERRRLVKEHENQLQRVRNECEFKVKDACAKTEAEFTLKMENSLKEARKEWEEQQQDMRVQLERENEQRTRRVVESARQEWHEQQKKEVTKACEQAVRRQRELSCKERRENQSALEKLKHELVTVKKEYALSMDTLKREVLEEKKKTQHDLKRQSSRDSADQTTVILNSGTDASFSSVDHMTASRGLHELRQHYLDTIAKIRQDVLDHVNQTKISASKKIRGEVLKERHSTAKKLRRYYLQCLKQLLEEDRMALEGSSFPSSAEDKLKRMAVALKTPSPSKESTGQPSPPASLSQGDQSPRPDVFNRLRSGSETNIREPPIVLSTSDSSERHRECGPDGASDSVRLSARKESGPLTPVLGDLITKDDYETISCRSSDAKNFASKGESMALRPYGIADVVSKDAFQTLSGNSVVPRPAEEHVSGATSELHYRQKTKLDASAEKEMQKVFARPAQTQAETGHIQKPLAAVKRSSPSPSLSVISVESDQYNELPTVIRIPKQNSISTSLVRPPSRDVRPRPRAENRIGKLVSRDRATNGSPGLPSKPRVDVNNNFGANRVRR